MRTPIIVAAIVALTASAMAQATYTWNQSGAAAYNVASNWTPARNTPAVDDILIIDGTTTPTRTITTVQTETIGELHIINGAYATLSSAASITLTVNGGASTKDLEVASGSTLKLTGGSAFIVTISLGATANGVVEGDVIFNATGSSTPHRILANQVDGLVFESGATAAAAPTTTGAGGGFGGSSAPTSVDNGVRFKNGSTYYQGGLKDGTRNGGTGSNPFAKGAPASCVVFDADATYVTWESIPSISGRTYGNFIWRNSVAQTVGGSGVWTVNGDLIFRNSGIAGQGACNMTGQSGNIVIAGDVIIESGAAVWNATPAPAGARTWEIKGNVDIQDAALFTAPTNANITVVLNGTAAQTVDFAGDTLPNLSVNNAAGVLLADGVTVSTALDLASGEVATSPTEVLAANGTVSRTTGFVTGSLARSLNVATAPTTTTFAVGTPGAYTPVDVLITGAGTGTGTVTVTAKTGDQPNAIDAAASLDRYWTITPTGISGYTATLVFNYLDGDVTGTAVEADLKGAAYETGWTTYPATVLNAGLNKATVPGVTALSDWTLVTQATAVDDWTMF